MCKCGYGRNGLYFYPLQERYVPLVQVIPPALDVKYNCDYLGWIHWAHAEESIYLQNILLDLTVHDNAVSLWEAEIEGIAGLRSSWMHSETISKNKTEESLFYLFSIFINFIHYLFTYIFLNILAGIYWTHPLVLTPSSLYLTPSC